MSSLLAHLNNGDHMYLVPNNLLHRGRKVSFVRDSLKPRFYWQVIKWALCERPFKRQMVTERSLLKEAGG